MINKMQEYTYQVQRTLIQILMLALVLSIMAYFAGQVRAIPGLVLGTVGSIIYFLLMSYRVRRSVAMPPEKAVAYMRSGWLVRLSFVVMLLIISVRVPQINFVAAVIGLFSLQLVIMFNAVSIIAKSLWSGHGKP